ncbi:DoxX family protein [uncultured Kiloniella sp.]|uniref:DoxX family protein n=1 Tax=uncultured Kiloniella sp. TaxID=1133091 RepID=UPI00262F3907|nr:DoxX family protein [uncultured Kiloniella sp.]
MSQNNLTEFTTFVLRVALGVMYLAHGVVLKFYIFGLAGTADFFETIGFPGWIAYVVFTAELIGGSMLVLGIQARWVALALLPILFGAVWVHAGNGWVFSYPNGGWEYPVYLILLSFAQFALGDGRFALSRSRALPNGIS